MKPTSKDSIKIKSLFGNYPGKTLHRIGAFMLGVWLGNLGLRYILKESNNYLAIKNIPFTHQTNGALSLKEEIKVLIFITEQFNSETIVEDKTENRKMNELSDLLFINSSDRDLSAIIQIPINKSFYLDSGEKLSDLKDIFNSGYIKLTVDIIDNIKGLEDFVPDKYLLLSKELMHELLDKSSMNYRKGRSHPKANTMNQSVNTNKNSDARIYLNIAREFLIKNEKYISTNLEWDELQFIIEKLIKQNISSKRINN